MARYEWCGVSCRGDFGERVASWFRPFVPEAWGPAIKADVQEDVNTGDEGAMRALFRLPDGSLKEAVRRRQRSRGTVTITTRSPSAAILKGFRLPVEAA